MGMTGRATLTVSRVFSPFKKEVPEDVAERRVKAEKLLEHMRTIMSFAAGTNLRRPVAEFRHGIDVNVTVTSCSEQRRAELSNFHPLDRQTIFETGVRAFFSPPIVVENLWMALEWFSMTASYNEVRLVNAMTALESLVNYNVRDKSLLLKDSTFTKLKRVIRAAIKQFIEENMLNEEHPDLNCELEEKLAELQRHTLKRKLRILIEHWSVPIEGMDDEMISAAINARNHVVHEGRYYAKGKEQTNLWVHVTVVRELVTRIVFTALGFRGRYISHLGGYHHAVFPPDAKSA